MKYAAIEQLILFAVVALFSLLSSAVQKSRKKGGNRPPVNPPIPHWPRTHIPAPAPNRRPPARGTGGMSEALAEELKRLLDPSKVSPPVILEAPRTVPLRELATPEASLATYTRASQLDEEMGARMKQVEEQIGVRARVPVRAQNAAGGARNVRAWIASPRAAQNAFAASVIFGPPKAFEY